MKYSKPLYAILGLYIPFSVLLLWAQAPGIIYSYFAQTNPGIVLDAKLWCLTGFLSALAASCYAGLMKKSRFRHSAADFRGGIAALLVAYILSSLLWQNISLVNTTAENTVWVQRFIPSVNTVIAALAALFMWFPVISLREIFNGLELFESFITQHRGEQLREVMREYSPEMSQTDSGLKSLALSYGVQFIPPCLLIIAAGSPRVSPALTVLMLFIFSAGFLLLGFMRLLRRELACASEGISLTIRDRSLPLPIMALGTGIAVLLALAASSDTSILPPGIILGFFAWLGKLLSLLFSSPEQLDLSQLGRNSGPMRLNRMRELFPEVDETGPWPGWKWIKYGVIAIAAFLFLLFMIHPLLKRHSLRVRKLRVALARWFRDLKKGFLAFFTALRDRGASVKLNRPDAEKLRRIASELLPGGIRRKELKRSVDLFARLILWGIESLAVPWKPSIAPGEYCALLAAAVTPANGEIPAAIIRCGELFEKALYSASHLSAEEEGDFRRMVLSVTGTA